MTEEMKEVLGMHDTDTDESDSSTGGESSGEDSEDMDVDDAEIIQGVEDESESEGEDEDEGGASGDEDDSVEDEELTRPPLSVTETMTDPMYSVSSSGYPKACAVCPTKRFKSEAFVEEHKNSKVSLQTF